MFKGVAYATLFVSTLTVVDSLGFNINFIHSLPLNGIRFNWIIPEIIGAIFGKIIAQKDKKITYAKGVIN